MTDSVDLSWLNDIHKPPTYFSKEPLTTADVFFIYVNKSNHIEKIVGENHPLIHNVLEKEVLISLIQKRRNPQPNIRYKLLDTLLFFIDVDPNNIQDFVNSESSLLNNGDSSLLKSLPIIDDITIDPTITLFHDINSIFVVLQEMTPVLKPFTKSTPVPVSILKPTNTINNGTNKKTKRVRISPDVIERVNNKTAKSRENL